MTQRCYFQVWSSKIFQDCLIITCRMYPKMAMLETPPCRLLTLALLHSWVEHRHLMGVAETQQKQSKTLKLLYLSYLHYHSRNTWQTSLLLNIGLK